MVTLSRFSSVPTRFLMGINAAYRLSLILEQHSARSRHPPQSHGLARTCCQSNTSVDDPLIDGGGVGGAYVLKVPHGRCEKSERCHGFPPASRFHEEDTHSPDSCAVGNLGRPQERIAWWEFTL